MTGPPELPKVRSFGDLVRPGKDSPDELIQHRFLCREGIMLLAAPTGVGKSSLMLQLGIHLAVGRGCFGFELGKAHQGKGLRILLVQAENDDGDLAEMWDGVMTRCDHFSPAERDRVLSQFNFCTLAGAVGPEAVATLDQIVAASGPFDLVILDPLLAYVGCDINVQFGVSSFLRDHVLPFLRKHKAGMVLVHHTNKPIRSKDAAKLDGKDLAYQGAGSAEFANISRSIVLLRPTTDSTIFELRAVKRESRLGWVDLDGKRTSSRFIAHDPDPSVICWHSVDEADAKSRLQSAKPGRPAAVDLIDVIHCILADPGNNQAAYKRRIGEALACGPTAVRDAFAEAVSREFLEFKESGRQKLYQVTEKGRKRASDRSPKHDWRPV